MASCLAGFVLAFTVNSPAIKQLMTTPLPLTPRLRVLISSYDFPPIPYDLADAFKRAGAEVCFVNTSNGTEPAFFRRVIKPVNQFVRHFRSLTGPVRFFASHPDDRPNWLDRQLREACTSFKPDIIFFIHGHTYGDAILNDVSAKKIGWWIEPDDEAAKLQRMAQPFDLYTSFSAKSVERLREAGIPTAYLCHGVNLRSFYPVAETPKLYDLSFVGNWSPWREEVLQKVLSVTHNVALYGPTWTRKTRIPRSLFKQIFKGEKIQGAQLNTLYNQSKVVLNAQRLQDTNGLNMRYFEVTAAGACLLTDGVPELGWHFVPNEHLCVYHTPDDLSTTLGRLLADDAWRNTIAHMGYKQVIAHNTYDHFVDKVLSMSGAPNRNRTGTPCGPGF